MKGILKEDTEEKAMEELEEKEQKQEAKLEENHKEKEEVKEEKENINENAKFKKVKEKSKKIEKEKQKMDTPNKRKNKAIFIIIGIIIIVGIFCSTIFALVNINNENIISGISISGIDVSGLSKEKAIAKMETIYQEKKEKEIGIKYKEYETTLNPTLMEVNYEIEKAVEEAYSFGRGSNIFINNYNILYALLVKKDINVNMTLNEDVAKQTITDIGVNLPGLIIESSYAIEEDQLIITKGKAGVAIKVEELLNKVKEQLCNLNANENIIEIPVMNKEPEPIDIEKIHEEIYTEAKDAYYTKDPFTIYPEVNGIDFDVEAAKVLLQEEKEEYVISLTITKPKVTIDQIGSEAFPNRLAIFTTRYDASDVNRTTNLIIACQKINGKVVASGETFSYNEALGPRTSAAGYRNGKIYSGGKVVDGIGGGICQISSTLYNSVLMANLEIVERRNHQFVTSYVSAGRDATVVYGVTDFKFKNTRQYPVRISASAQNGIATVAIYGIKEENEYTFDFYTKVIATIAPTTKYEEDASLEVGTEKVTQKGTNGVKTETYMTKMLNGKVISTTLLSRDTYNAMERIILKGTKEKKETTTTNKDTNPTTTTDNTNTTNNNTTSNKNTTTEETTQKPSTDPTTSSGEAGSNTTTTEETT